MAQEAVTAAARPVARTLGGAIARLRRIEPGRHWVVSCYVRIAPADRPRGAYLIELKNRIRAAYDALEPRRLPRGARQALDRDFDRILDAVRNPAHLPPVPGFALFACESLGLFETVPVARVHRTRVVVDRTPLVRELVAAEAEFGRVLVAAVDRAHARFFEVGAFTATELPCVPPMATRGGKFHSDRRGSPGWGERHYHSRITREKERQYEAAARRLLDLHHSRPATGLVIGGPGREAGAAARFLDPSLADRLLGTTRLNPTALSAADVYAATAALRETHRGAAERRAVAEFKEALGNGWAVNGVRDTLLALFRGQARSLLLHAAAELPGFRCAGSRRLVRQAGECGADGPPEPVPDLVNDVIEESLAQHLPIVMVRDPEAARQINDLAAILRFR